MNDEAINRIAEKVMGGGAPQQPAQPAQGAQPQPGQAPGQPPQAPAKEQATPASTQEKVSASTSPKTEGDKTDEMPVEYEIEFGENDRRKLSPSQIKGTFERYAAMNRENAQMKPVLDLVRQLTTEAGADPKQIADFMQSQLRAQAKNATLGQQGQDDEGKKKETNSNSDDPFKTWEMETGASLPPQYKEMMETNQKLSGELQQMKEMMTQVLQASKGQFQGAQEQQAQAQSDKVGAIRGEIKNNLNKMAQGLGFSDDQAQDFMAFMADRGYTFEDFVDPDLTMRVGGDFKNALQSGDFDRLKKIAERRSAVAGQMGAAPTQGGGDAPQPSEADQTFDRMVNKTMQKRMIG